MNSTNNADTSQKSTEKINVLVVATQNDAISKYRSIVSECSLSASFLKLKFFLPSERISNTSFPPVLLIDFGASRTKLSIVEFGMVKNYHTIDRGGADISDSISKSLNIPFSEAEKMKKEFGLFGNGAEKSLPTLSKFIWIISFRKRITFF